MRLIKAPKKLSLHPGSPFYTLEDFEAEHQLGDPRLWADVMALQVGARSGVGVAFAWGGIGGWGAGGEGLWLFGGEWLVG